MMNNFFKACTIAAIFASLVIFANLLHSREVKKIPPAQAIKNVKPVNPDLVTKTDLRVDAIHSSHCLCELNEVDAFYMANIMVDVSNHKVNGVGFPTESILTVTYFDLVQGRIVSITKNLLKMHPYPTNPWTFQRYEVVNGPVLVKKSVGIKAEIKPKNTAVTDAIPVNNMKIATKCMVMVY